MAQSPFVMLAGNRQAENSIVEAFDIVKNYYWLKENSFEKT